MLSGVGICSAAFWDGVNFKAIGTTLDACFFLWITSPVVLPAVHVPEGDGSLPDEVCCEARRD
jgi:hypothetical protein